MFITLIMVIETWSMDMSKLIKSFILNMQFFMCAHCILIMMLNFFFLPTSKKRCEDEITYDPLPIVSTYGH